MILDHNPARGTYFLKVPRSSKEDIKLLMSEHGLDFSSTASTSKEAVLFTHEPYCAVSFHKYATPRALESFSGILKEINESWRAESKAHIACPPDQELWGFQKADIEYALRRKHSLVGDQPGLGKTPVGICFANEIRAKRVLVVCPAAIRLQWTKRIYEWSTFRWPHNVVHTILNGKRGTNPAATYTVISYELARHHAILESLIRDGRFDLVILDEVHYLKTINALRTRAIFGGGNVSDPISDHCGHIMALSGTPLLNRPREAYTVCRGLEWGCIDFMSEEKFKLRFNPSIQGQRIDPATGLVKTFNDERTGRFGELQNRMRANLMVRHLKREVMPQLKLPIYDIIQLEETQAVKQALAAESLLDIDPDNLEGADIAFGGQVSTVRLQMGRALAPQIADYIDMIIEGGETKLVVFAWHTEVMNFLEQRWSKHGCLRIDGTTSTAKRQRLVDLFVADPSKQIILGNSMAMGTGTDGLQKVSGHAFIAEPDWTPGINIQCFDRLDRGGQVRQVQGDIFVAPNSFAERVLATALRKNQTIHKTLDRRIG